MWELNLETLNISKYFIWEHKNLEIKQAMKYMEGWEQSVERKSQFYIMVD